MFAELHTDHGVDLRCGVTVAAIRAAATDPTTAGGVLLADGTTLDADVIVVGVGVTPNVELARACLLDVDNGVLVDQHLRTSDVDICAAGDVANAYHPLLGRQLRVEHWANALNQPAVAATDDARCARHLRSVAVLLHRPVRPRHGVHRLRRSRGDEVVIRGDLRRRGSSSRSGCGTVAWWPG